MPRFVVRVKVSRRFESVAIRYVGTDAPDGFAAISNAREQMRREAEPPADCRASYHAKRCPLGVTNPF